MKTGVKVLLGAGVLGTVGGIIYAATRPSAAQAAGPQSIISIKIYDKYGNLVAGRFANGRVATALPGGMIAGGGPYTAVLTLVNNTVYQGTTTPAPYTFAVNLSILVGANTLLVITKDPVAIAAGGTYTYSKTFTIPISVFGYGTATASIMNTAGTTTIATATPLSFTVVSTQVHTMGTIVVSTPIPTMTEGQTANIAALIMNASVYKNADGTDGSVIAGASFKYQIALYVGGGLFASGLITTILVGPGQAYSATAALPIPYGYNGAASVRVILYDLNNNIINQPADLTGQNVVPAAVTPGGTISF